MRSSSIVLVACLLALAPIQAQDAAHWEKLQTTAKEQKSLASRGGVASIAAVMESLDPKESGAFVSAHLLAAEVLLRNTKSGAKLHVEAAARTLGKHARRPKVGKCAKALDKYGKGMLKLAKGEPKAAVVPLSQALDIFIRESWLRLAVHASTELCALQLSLEDPDGAKRTIAKVSRLVTPKTDPDVIMAWRKLVKNRLGDAPAGVLVDYHAAMKPFERMSVSAAGGAGGAGAPGGPARQSEVMRNLGKVKGKKPLFSVRRTQDGFLIRKGYDKKFKAVLPYKSGVVHHGEGGIVLSFCGYAVGLYRLDSLPGNGLPGNSSRPDWTQAFYHLADKETFSVTRSGKVLIQ